MVSNKAELNLELQAIEDRGNHCIYFEDIKDLNSIDDEYREQFKIYLEQEGKTKKLFENVLSGVSEKLLGVKNKAKKPSPSFENKIIRTKYEFDFKSKKVLVFKLVVVRDGRIIIDLEGYIVNSFQDPEIPLIRTWYEIEKIWDQEDLIILSRMIKSEIGNYRIR